MGERYVAGAAKRVITPPPGMPMAGYINRAEKASGKLDDLYARALYIRSPGGGELLLISLDIIRVDNDLYESIVDEASRKLGVQRSSIHVAATHTHSGPEVSVEVWNTRPLTHGDRAAVEEYRRRLVLEATEAAAEAIKQAAESRVLVGSARVAGVASNRVEPRGPVDDEAVLLIVEGDRGARAIAVNYACHPTVLGPSNTLYSGDLAGYVSSLLEEEYGAVTLYLNGAAGNISTRFTRRKQDYSEVRVFASRIASAVKKAIDGGGLEELPTAGITTRVFEEEISLREPPSDAELQRAEEELRRRIEEARARGYGEATLRGLLSDLAATMISRERRRFLLENRRVKLRVSVARVDTALSMVFFPGEAFIEYQITAKKHSSTKYTMFIGYADGYLGYIPYTKNTPRPMSYEEVVSIISPSEYRGIEELLKKAVAWGEIRLSTRAA